MSAITIGPDFDECRMRIFANGGDDLAQFVAHFAKVHPVNDFTRNVVTFGAIDDLLQRCRSFHRRSHGKEVVLANEDDGKLVERDEV